MEFFGVVLLILGCIGFGLFSKYARERKQIQLSKMIHNERMKAMEKGLPLSEIGHDELSKKLLQMHANADTFNGISGRGIVWLRVYALCLGLLLFLGGIGVMSSLHFVHFQDAPLFWPLGLIPALMGLGLLLFCHLTKKHEDQMKGDR